MNRKKRILLVDDERDFVDSLAERLNLRGFDTCVAHDGDEALQVLQNETFFAMVLDLRMPNTDGFQVLEALNQQKERDMPVIVLTGHGSAKDKETCMGLGAKAYMHKPVDVAELVTTLRQVMGV